MQKLVGSEAAPKVVPDFRANLVSFNQFQTPPVEGSGTSQGNPVELVPVGKLTPYGDWKWLAGPLGELCPGVSVESLISEVEKED